MPINRLFAQDSATMDGCADQLVDALVKLLEEPQNLEAAAAIADLHVAPQQSVHVSVGNAKKTKPGTLSCQ